MRNPKDILVTTTDVIDGIEIIQFIKPISAHVVTGTGLFSDFAASISDVFGGRSQSYQKQLSSIYNEAIDNLKRTAFDYGANCIVGLKVDLDEIAGKGKSMFMITAVGTAVIIENQKKKTKEIVEYSDLISSEKMIELRQRNLIIDNAKNYKLILNESTWEFLTENNVNEIASEVFKIAQVVYDELFDGKDILYQRLVSYLNILPDDIKIPLLYEQIIENDSVHINSKFFLLIKELMVIDYVRLERYLNSSNVEQKAKALQIISYDKTYYIKEDILFYEKFIEIVKSKFKKFEIISQKKMLSSKEVELWVCYCDRKNDMQIEYCENCGRDIYGYLKSEINPDKAISIMTQNIDIIRTNIK